MIQEEKESTELRAEELETRVTSGSMEALDLTQLHKRGSIPTSLTALSLASASNSSFIAGTWWSLHSKQGSFWNLFLTILLSASLSLGSVS